MAGSSGSPIRRLGLPAVRRSTRSAGAVAFCAASGVAGRLASGPQRRSRPLSHPPAVRAPLDLVALSVLRTRMADHPAWPRSSPGGMPLLLAPEGGVASAGLIPAGGSERCERRGSPNNGPVVSPLDGQVLLLRGSR